MHEEGEFCGYYSVLGAMHVIDSFERLRAYMQDKLERYLEGRIHYKHLKPRGWEVSEILAKSSIFANEELIQRTEKIFAVKF